jgi:hypothetical protein
MSLYYNPSPEEIELRAEINRLRGVIDSLAGVSETANRVTFYEREFYPLSNFSSFQVYYDLRLWPTSEHAYQAMKFSSQTFSVWKSVRDNEYIRQEEIRNQKSAHDAYKLANSMNDVRRPDWNDVRVKFMIDICRHKLHQHKYVQKKLVQTGNREIIESSPTDNFWGWGPNRDGQNMLGKIWMTLRMEWNAGTHATGIEWLRRHNEANPDQPVEIIDPDGWRRNDGVYFETPITKEDFEERLCHCTVSGLQRKF